MEFGYGDWKSEFKHRRKATSSNHVDLQQSLHHHANYSRQTEDLSTTKKGRKRQPPPANRMATWFVIAVGVAAGASFLLILTKGNIPEEQRQRQVNKHAMVQWRRSVQSKCQRFLHALGSSREWSNEYVQKSKNRIDQWALNQFQFPPDHRKPVDTAVPHDAVPCQYAFVDWGMPAKGEALGAWMELALDICTPLWHKQRPDLPWTNASMSRPRWNPTTMQVSTTASSGIPDGWPEVSAFRRYLYQWTWQPDSKRPSRPPLVYPEDFCILGVVQESEDRDSEDLWRLGRFVDAIQPPLFRSFQIEHVNAPLNSLPSDDKAVGHQAELLATILRRTMIPLLPYPFERTSKTIKGGILMIRVNFSILASRILQHELIVQILCEYRQGGNSVIVLLEPGNVKPHENGILSTAKNCGVHFVDLEGY